MDRRKGGGEVEREERYITVGKRRLRCGYTTGTCAAAAAAGAAELLLTGQAPRAAAVELPAGGRVTLELEEPRRGEGWACCAVRKDGGDDPDVTHGALIRARVSLRPAPGVSVEGGEGVGRVTRPGLDQPVGRAAINSVPRGMIARTVQERLDSAGCSGGALVVIEVPGGGELAARTFNPRLGIQGGISILGTTGVVRPMSRQALADSLCLELDVLRAAGAREVILTPGNYGAEFARQTLGLELKQWAECGNFIGRAIDHAAAAGFARVLLIGHLGKLCKVAGGCMDTHSSVADGRRETLTAHAALCGAGVELLGEIFRADTTDRAVELLEGAGLRRSVMDSLAAALEENLRRRAGEGMEIAAVFFSRTYGLLGQTEGAQALLRRFREIEKGGEQP